MLTIYKFPIGTFLGLPAAEFSIDLPRTAQVLHVAAQNNLPCIWVRLNLEEPTEPRFFRTALTGKKYDDDYLKECQHRGTVLLDEGAFVVHVFEVSHA